MAQANPDNSTPMAAVSTRRRFLSQAAGVAAGGAVLALAAIPPTQAAAAPASPLAAGEPDPIFSAIDAYNKARRVFDAAANEHILAERELQAAGHLFPRTISKGNPYSRFAGPVFSTTHEEIDRYTPAEMFTSKTEREHAELSSAISRL